MGATSLHFSNAELQCHCGCNQNLCTQELVDALEALRALAGKPISVDSAYRCEKHNSALPNAAKHSQHELGNAADIVIQGMTPAEMEQRAQLINTIGGIGRADHQGYIHIDVRPRLIQGDWPPVASSTPTPAIWDCYGTRWCYDSAGNECAWYPAVVT